MTPSPVVSTNSSTPHWLENEHLLSELYRAACLLQNSPEKAVEQLHAEMKKLAKRPEIFEPERGTRVLLAGLVGQNRKSAPGDSLPSLLQTSGLTGQEKAALSLFFATTLPPATIGKILGLPEASLRGVLSSARKKLRSAGADSKAAPSPDAENLLERPWLGGETNASPTPPQEAETRLHSQITALGPAPETLQSLLAAARDAEHHATHKPFSLRDPGLLAAGFALLLVLGFGIWSMLAKADSISGEAELRQLLAEATSAGAEAYEPVESRLTELADWFVLKGIDSFRAPPGFGMQQTLAARVFQFEGTKVAAAILPDQEMLVFVFEGAALGINVQPEGSWRIFEAGQDAFAVMQNGKMCFLVAKRGSEKSLEKALFEILPSG